MLESQLRQWIRTQLGSPVVSVALTDEQLNQLIATAIATIEPFYTGVSYISKTFTPGTPIDLTAEGVVGVVHVFEAPAESYVGDSSDDWMFQAVNYADGGFDIRDFSLRSYQRSEMNYMMDKNFRFMNGKLYLDDFRGTELMIECLKPLTTLSDVADETSLQWVMRYTLALSKLAEGEIRRKIRPVNAPYELDGDALVSDGTSERATLEEALGANSNVGFFFVTR